MVKKYTYDYPMAPTAVTAVILVHDFGENKYLSPYGGVVLGFRSEKSDAFPEKWSLPGGFVNIGKETVQEAMSREVFEETGITVSKYKWILHDVRSDMKTDPRYDQVINIVFVTVVSKEDIIDFKAGDDLKKLTIAGIKDINNYYPCAFDHEDILDKVLRAEYYVDPKYLKG